MKLLITGGCGFLGSNLAEHAMKEGMDLVIFDDLSRTGANDNLQWLKKKGHMKFVHGDIRSQEDINVLVREFVPEAVFHLAGQVAMTTSIADPRNDFEINALGSLNILEAVRKYAHNAPVIYSSTNKVYGDLEQYHYVEKETRYECLEKPEGFDESTPLDFHSPYGCSKGAADQYMLDYARIYGLQTVVFRHSSMYGGRQYATFDQGWIGWFCQQALNAKNVLPKQPFTISGSGKQVRDVLHSDDILSLYFTALQNSRKAAGQAFNIGGGMSNSLSLLELFALLEELIGVSLKFQKLPERQSDQKVFIADITKANEIFGWQPKVAPQKGIADMIEWTKYLTS